MDLKSFVDRAKEAANTAALKAQEAASALAASAAPSAAHAGAAQPGSAQPEPAQPEHAHDLESQDGAEGTERALAESPLPTSLAPTTPAPVPAKSFSVLANEKLNELSAVGAQKIQELVNAFQQSLPAIKSAGYELTEFEVELGVTPKLIPHFKHAPKSAEDIDAAREALKDNKLGQIILGALVKAGDVHRQIRVAGFGFSHIEIEMGLIPSVRLQYKQD